jgi:hypothetical protein
MVKTREEVAKDRAEQFKQRIATESPYVIPEFTTDDDGIPYCTKQTDYNKIISLNLKERYPNEFEKMLTCLRCDHYKNDDCYFPKQDIDRIEHDREKLTIKCNLCGTKIHRLFSILMSMFYKAQYNISMPIICCTCFNALNNNSFIKNTQRRMILFVISLVTSMYFLFSYFLTIFLFNAVGVLLFILPFAFWGYISVRDMKNLYYLYKGRKYYQQVFAPVIEAEKAESSSESASTTNSDNNQPRSGENNDNPEHGSNYPPPGYEY